MTASHVLTPTEPDAARPAPGSRAPRRRFGGSAVPLQIATVVFLLVLVDVVTRSGVVGDEFPTVTATAGALWLQVTVGEFWAAVWATTFAWLAGFAIAALLAVPTGLFIASSRFAFRSSRLLIDFLRPIPPIAVLPLAVLVLGSGFQMKLWLVVFSTFWPILFQTMYGAQDVDPVARDTSRAYGLNRIQQYRHIVLPSATPYIATGLRLASTIALVVTIATELVVGSSGLGYRINQVRYADDTPAMYALILVAGLLGWASTVVFRVAERKALFWHASQRKDLDQ